MHVSLLLVGAHDGHKMNDWIMRASQTGVVILIEPVPWLCAKLRQRYAGHHSIICLQRCIALTSGPVKFYAPTEQAVTTAPWGDQLGSLNAAFATGVDPAFAPHIVEIEAVAVTFADLVRHFEIASVDTLFTDTEGFDAALVPSFPFEVCKPQEIVFEHKHADGVSNIGRNLGRLLVMLDETGYDIQVIDVENCRALLRPA